MEATNPLLTDYRHSSLSGRDMFGKEFLVETKPPPFKSRMLNYGLIMSLMLNIALAAFTAAHTFSGYEETIVPQTSYDPIPQGQPHSNSSVSPFAGLQRNIPKQWTGNSFTTQQAWNETWDSVKIYPGIIALSDAYALEKGLPRSQRWPWDPTRGVYVLNSHHNLHCLLNIKQSFEESREGRPQTIDYGHIQHCLLVLRDDILCNADDTPRYSGYQEWGKTAYGQVRMCRNWTQLEEWALRPQQEGCWRPVPGVLGDLRSDGSNHLLERYRFCSELNPYKEKAETMWRDVEEWNK